MTTCLYGGRQSLSISPYVVFIKVASIAQADSPTTPFSSAMTEPSNTDVALSKRIAYIALQKAFNGFRYVQQSRLFAAATQPDERKLYPCRPNLFANRIFRPAGLGADAGELPLLILIHGGGFIVNNPSADDALARRLADTANSLVVSIDYSKAPQNPFPAGYEDVVALCLAVIDDDALHINKRKVVLAGNSAGGNFALGAAQDPRLRSRILGVLGLYVSLDPCQTL